MQPSRLAVLLCLALASASFGQKPTKTGGPLRFEQAVFDVQSYDVTLKVNPTTKYLVGTTKMIAKVTIPTNVILLDLDTPYRVTSLTDSDGKPLRFDRGTDTLRVWFPQSLQVGETLSTSVSYAGSPRVAPNAPWTGGVMWSKTPSGAHWISFALQNDGADLLFPCKDHPSDKPDTAAMHITVPDPLVAVGPGKAQPVQKNGDGTSTYNWLMTNPIANYSIVFNAAPYKLVEDSTTSLYGDTIPIQFYVIPEDEPKAKGLIAETKKYVAFYEKYLGPFPFRSQKLGIVETPHLGMEHSTAIAYGNKFRYSADGHDWLMLHEFGHEWWANLVTASDWRDFWIHEGFQSYMDSLYQEHLGKPEAYFTSMQGRRRSINNKQPIAPREPKYSYEVYMSAPDYNQGDGDIYDKGALVLHSLRYLIGDEAFFKSLRQMAYPRAEMERWTDGRQERLVTTDDYVTIAESVSGRKLGWFFEVYTRQASLPKLTQTVVGKELRLQWEAPNGLPFKMPIDVVVDGKTQRVEMPNGKAVVKFSGAVPKVDPKGWVLRA